MNNLNDIRQIDSEFQDVLKVIRNAPQARPSARNFRQEYNAIINQSVQLTELINNLNNKLLSPGISEKEKSDIRKKISEYNQILSILSENEKELGKKIGKCNKKSQNNSINTNKSLDIINRVNDYIKYNNLNNNLLVYTTDILNELKAYLKYYPIKLTTLKKISNNQFNTLVNFQEELNNYIKDIISIKNQTKNYNDSFFDNACMELDIVVKELNCLLKPIDEVINRENQKHYRHVTKISQTNVSKNSKYNKPYKKSSSKPKYKTDYYDLAEQY